MRRLHLAAIGLSALLALAAINGAVQLLGGDPFLLSPLRLADKSEALGRFALHTPYHVLGRCEVDTDRLLQHAARRHRVPVDFVRAVARAESRSRSHAVSRAGAMGVLQLMPDTARRFGVRDPFDPEHNIDGGVRYLRELWLRYGGDRVRVAAAYNAGPGVVPRRGVLALPRETQRYVRKVVGS